MLKQVKGQPKNMFTICCLNLFAFSPKHCMVLVFYCLIYSTIYILLKSSWLAYVYSLPLQHFLYTDKSNKPREKEIKSNQFDTTDLYISRNKNLRYLIYIWQNNCKK